MSCLRLQEYPGDVERVENEKLQWLNFLSGMSQHMSESTAAEFVNV